MKTIYTPEYANRLKERAMQSFNPNKDETSIIALSTLAIYLASIQEYGRAKESVEIVLNELGLEEKILDLRQNYQTLSDEQRKEVDRDIGSTIELNLMDEYGNSPISVEKVTKEFLDILNKKDYDQLPKSPLLFYVAGCVIKDVKLDSDEVA